MSRRVGGIIEIKVDGNQYSAKGEFTCNTGGVKREGVLGQDAFHGFKEAPTIAFVEGSITDHKDTDLEALFAIEEATVTVTLANGKIFVGRKFYWAGDNQVQTGEGEVPFRMEGEKGEFVR